MTWSPSGREEEDRKEGEREEERVLEELVRYRRGCPTPSEPAEEEK